ncbi:MAG: prenyltransferase [Anaerolineae bacterium]|nr:prenyltransferase [Anaerolineae bacterium]
MKQHPIWLLLRLSRPFFLLGGFMQYSLGAGIAQYLGYEIEIEIYILGLLWVLAGQLSVHYLNEYYDSGPDRENPNRTPFTGGSGVLGEGKGLLPRYFAIMAAATMLTAVSVLTFGLMQAGRLGIEAGVVAILIFLMAFFYSVPPLRLVASGYGELTTSIILANLLPAFGLLLQTGEFNRLVAMSTFPMTPLIMAMLIAFEFPDYGTDSKFEKKTLLVRVGWQTGVRLHHLFIGGAYIILAGAMYFGLPIALAWPPLLTLPLGLAQIWYLDRIAQGQKPNWTALTFMAVMLFGLFSYITAFIFWTR